MLFEKAKQSGGFCSSGNWMQITAQADLFLFLNWELNSRWEGKTSLDMQNIYFDMKLIEIFLIIYTLSMSIL